VGGWGNAVIHASGLRAHGWTTMRHPQRGFQEHNVSSFCIEGLFEFTVNAVGCNRNLSLQSAVYLMMDDGIAPRLQCLNQFDDINHVEKSMMIRKFVTVYEASISLIGTTQLRALLNGIGKADVLDILHKTNKSMGALIIAIFALNTVLIRNSIQSGGRGQ
jgi:hypothetical protein